MAESARHVLYGLLDTAILEMRAASEVHCDEDDRRFVNLLAYLIHNWPEKLRDVRTDAEHEALLHELWRQRDTRLDPWLRDRLTFLGRNPDEFSA